MDDNPLYIKPFSRQMLKPQMQTLYKLIMLSLLVLLIFTSHIQAQRNLVAGYMITNEGDTIQGLIKDEDWSKSPDNIRFKVKGSSSTKVLATNSKGFGLLYNHKIYKSKKIGLVNISSKTIYAKEPSVNTEDSIQVFLQEMVAGSHATLYLYLNAVEEPHYFLEANEQFEELYYYPFLTKIDGKTYRGYIDNYKEQLRSLSGNSYQFNDTIPAYQEKYLKHYIARYNHSFLGAAEVYQSKVEKATFDLDVNAGLENWSDRPVEMHHKATFGIGFRISFPRKFQNRYVKVNYFVTPGVHVGNGRNDYNQTSLRTIEVSVGSYIGSHKIRPYYSFLYSGVNREYRSDFMGFQAGLSYNRRFNFEIGHFANIYSAITRTRFFSLPRISLHYFINLNFNRGKTSR